MSDPAELVECAFLVPLARNSAGQPHQPSSWNALQDALYAAFGGSTGPELLYRGLRTVRGEYAGGSGERIVDESWRYIAAVPRDRLDELRQILRRAARTFDQEAIYLAVGGIVEFVRAAEGDEFLL